MKKPVADGLFLWHLKCKAATNWQRRQKRQHLVGMDAAYKYLLGNPVYLQTPGM
jgi:hypothetical protein